MELTEGVGESSSPPRAFGGFNYYDVRNDVYNRLVENGTEDIASNPGFRELLDAHFSRLPPSYGLDVNMDRVEDVLLHQKILSQAKDPEKRPVFHVRFVEPEVKHLRVTSLGKGGRLMPGEQLVVKLLPMIMRYLFLIRIGETGFMS